MGPSQLRGGRRGQRCWYHREDPAPGVGTAGEAASALVARDQPTSAGRDQPPRRGDVRGVRRAARASAAPGRSRGPPSLLGPARCLGAENGLKPKPPPVGKDPRTNPRPTHPQSQELEKGSVGKGKIKLIVEGKSPDAGAVPHCGNIPPPALKMEQKVKAIKRRKSQRPPCAFPTPSPVNDRCWGQG